MQNKNVIIFKWLFYACIIFGMEEVKENFAANVYYFRRLRGLTQAELAEKAGVTTGFIGCIENARSNVSFDIIAKIADVLNTNVKTLFEIPPETYTNKDHIDELVLKERECDYSITPKLADKLLQIIYDADPTAFDRMKEIDDKNR